MAGRAQSAGERTSNRIGESGIRPIKKPIWKGFGSDKQSPSQKTKAWLSRVSAGGIGARGKAIYRLSSKPRGGNEVLKIRVRRMGDWISRSIAVPGPGKSGSNPDFLPTPRSEKQNELQTARSWGKTTTGWLYNFMWSGLLNLMSNSHIYHVLHNPNSTTSISRALALYGVQALVQSCHYHSNILDW